MVPAIRVSGLRKTFHGRAPALDGVDLEVGVGEMVALIGASGSGKSTLLRHITGLAAADRGSVSRIDVFGRRVQEGGRAAADLRHVRAGIGFVFQQFNLVERLPLITNVLAGCLHRVPFWRGSLRWFTRGETQLALEALERVGIRDRAWQRASTLSGGQQQRGAIARALVQQARVILADEPIASLDPESSRRVMEILASINREDGCTVIVSLHQIEYALRYCTRVVALHQGHVAYDGRACDLTRARLCEIYGGDADLLFGDTGSRSGAPAREAAPATPARGKVAPLIGARV
jgi:phosphonate transport system ATP-binding protein